MSKGFRPSTLPEMDEDKRFRDPVVKVEVSVRVHEYSRQVEQHGHIVRFVPRRA